MWCNENLCKYCLRAEFLYFTPDNLFYSSSRAFSSSLPLIRVNKHWKILPRMIFFPLWNYFTALFSSRLRCARATQLSICPNSISPAQTWQFLSIYDTKTRRIEFSFQIENKVPDFSLASLKMYATGNLQTPFGRTMMSFFRPIYLLSQTTPNYLGCGEITRV